MFHKFSETQARVFGFVTAPISVVISILLAYKLGDYGLAAIVALVSTSVIALLSRALTPPWFGKTRSQIYSLAILSATTLAVLAPDALWIPVIEVVFKYLGFKPPSVPDFEQRTAILFILSLAVIILNFIWSHHQITPPSDVAPSEAESKFDTLGYLTLRTEFCHYMANLLDQYDRDVHWSDSDYRTLEAEVEIDRQGALRPKIVSDLIKAIHSDRVSRAFLLLGEPGAGKSVSLRRLCRKLYLQVQETGIVPIYVNLREWDGVAEPSDEDISNFILRHLKLQSGRAGIRFLDSWFEGMLDRGLLFFILDSFDEMPAVLDCDDASNRLHAISKAFDRFFNDLHRCRGILSSRFFRQPRGFRGRRLTIRPFSETQVRGAMRRWLLGQPVNPDQILFRLFREKPQFSSIVRNPFSADLVAQFLSHNPNELPSSYFAVFEDYVIRRLKEDTATLNELHLDSTHLLESATQIAWTMYQAEDVGLDVEVKKLRQIAEVPDLELQMTALRISRLARLGGLRTQRFSFAHRRFAEFFVVRRLLNQGTPIPFEAIPSDSRWRDCLVVYCGIAPESEARRLAEFSWSIFRNEFEKLESGNLVSSRPAIHCLRFLIDSFRGRLECISQFRENLSTLLLQLLKSHNLLVSKIAAEGLCLLPNNAREDGLAIAVERGVGWISETAIRSCRHCGSLGERSKNAIKHYLATIPTPELFNRFADLSFSLGLSEGFRGIRIGLIIETFSIPVMWIIWCNCFVQLCILAREAPVITAMQAYSVAFALFSLPLFSELIFARLVPLSQPTNDSSEAPFIQQKLRKFFQILPFRLGYDTSVRFGSLFALMPLIFEDSKNIYDSGIGPIMRPAFYSAFFAPPLVQAMSKIIFTLANPKFLVSKILSFLKNWKSWGTVILGYSFLGLISLLLFKYIGIRLILIFGLSGLAAICCNEARIALLSFLAAVRDGRTLKRMDIPANLTRSWVYLMCLNLKSQWGRKRFLDILLAQDVRVESEPTSASIPFQDNAELSVRLARLEEKWLDLEL